MFFVKFHSFCVHICSQSWNSILLANNVCLFVQGKASLLLQQQDLYKQIICRKTSWHNDKRNMNILHMLQACMTQYECCKHAWSMSLSNRYFTNKSACSLSSSAGYFASSLHTALQLVSPASVCPLKTRLFPGNCGKNQVQWSLCWNK
jgi:hypothetical protein